MENGIFGNSSNWTTHEALVKTNQGNAVYIVALNYRVFYLILISIRTLQQPHITRKCNGQLQEATKNTILHKFISKLSEISPHQ